MNFIAWTYEGGIWTNPQGIAQSGYDGVLLQDWELNPETYNLVMANKMGVVAIHIQNRSDTEIRARVKKAIATFGTSLRYFYLPDEPNNKVNGQFTVSPARLGQIRDIIKAEAPGIPIWLNVIGRPDCYEAVAAAKPDYLTYTAYLNATGDCSYKNTPTSLKEGAEAVLAAYNRAGLGTQGKKLGVVLQNFQMTRCDMPKITTDYLMQIFNVALSVFGDKMDLVSGYAWKKDDTFDGQMPMSHPELWPIIKELSVDMRMAIWDFDPPPSEEPPKPNPATSMTISIPAGVKTITINIP